MKTLDLTAGPSSRFEDEARALGYLRVAGIDEAGRGPLAGPVVAAACFITSNFTFAGVNDSKKLNEETREELYHEITSHPDVIWGVGIIDPATIDTVNIYQATILAMLEATMKLSEQPDYLLVDGLKLPHPTIPSMKIIKGDALSHVIACASVLAKVTRDRLMKQYDEQYPEWEFAKHKGYGTPKHLKLLMEHGVSPIHRLTFAPCKTLPQQALA